MGTVKTEKVPEKYQASYFKLLVERLRTAVNFLDRNNFPNGVEGSIIKSRTLSLSALGQGEFHLLLVALAQAFTTTSDVLQNCSPFIYFDPALWGDGVSLYLEVTGGGVAESTGNAVFELHGANGLLTSLTTDGQGYLWYRTQNPFTPPSVAQTMILKMRSTVSGQGVGLMGAKVIIIP